LCCANFVRGVVRVISDNGCERPGIVDRTRSLRSAVHFRALDVVA